MLSSHPSAPSTVFLDRILRDLDSQLDRLQAARDTIAGLTASAITNEPLFAAASAPIAEVATGAVPRAAVAPALLPEFAQPTKLAPSVQSAESAHPMESVRPMEPAQPMESKRRGRPRGSRNRFPSARRVRQQTTPEPRALSSAIPAGPVVVSAAELARKREANAQHHAAAVAAKPAPPAEGTLEALIREVENRRHAA